MVRINKKIVQPSIIQLVTIFIFNQKVVSYESNTCRGPRRFLVKKNSNEQKHNFYKISNRRREKEKKNMKPVTVGNMIKYKGGKNIN